MPKKKYKEIYRKLTKLRNIGKFVNSLITHSSLTICKDYGINLYIKIYGNFRFGIVMQKRRNMLSRVPNAERNKNYDLWSRFGNEIRNLRIEFGFDNHNQASHMRTLIQITRDKFREK